jgi:hypothetical protein
MLTTSGKNIYQMEFTSSAVTIQPGVTRLNSSIMPFTGGRISFKGLAEFQGSDASTYKNTLLYLYDSTGVVGMSKISSDPEAEIRNLTFPVMPYSGDAGQPLAMFTLHTADGTNASLVSYKAL